jgi:zinc/manganese transport system substrate-binding protein
VPPSRLVTGAVGAVLLLAACSAGSSGSPGGDGPLRVTAAENIWGSIASQLGGDRVDVTSVVSNPDTDPHDYEPTPADARAVASADLVVANGLGYDAWAGRLVAANPSGARHVLDVGDLVGLKDGDNPHRWYSPDDVHRVIDQITADYKSLRPADAGYFQRRHDEFVTTGLAAYDAALADIRARFAGTKVLATESIFAPLATALGLDLVTPEAFLDAVSEGTDPSASDKATVDRLLTSGTVAVLVFNRQNATPDVQRLVDTATAEHLPVVTVTETISPRGATFQGWQTAQLQALAAALTSATAAKGAG